MKKIFWLVHIICLLCSCFVVSNAAEIAKKTPIVVVGSVTVGGKPISQVEISTDNAQTHTDDNGKYRLELPNTGKRVLYCSDEKTGLITRAYIDIKSELNTYNFKIPEGTISGKVINYLDGKNRDDGWITACRYTHIAFKNYASPRNNPKWVSFGNVKVNKDGSFKIFGVPRCKVMLEYYDSTSSVVKIVDLEKDLHPENIVLAIGQKGILDLTVIDSETKKPIANHLATLRSNVGCIINSGNNFTSPSGVNPGKYTLWLEPTNSYYLPVFTSVEVKPNKTTKVKMVLPRVKQRIVFKWSKSLKGKCPYTKEESKTCSTCYPVLNDPWIGYAISDAKTGKSVINTSLGSMWGGVITNLNSDTVPAIAVVPGRYKLNAVMKNISDPTANLKGSLWHFEGIVEVKPGKDSVLFVK